MHPGKSFKAVALAFSIGMVGSAAQADSHRPWMEWDLKGEIINIGYGGSFSAAEFEHCWDPFSELTGVEVKEIPWTSDIYEQVRTQVEMGLPLHARVGGAMDDRGEPGEIGRCVDGSACRVLKRSLAA